MSECNCEIWISTCNYGSYFIPARWKLQYQSLKEFEENRVLYIAGKCPACGGVMQSGSVLAYNRRNADLVFDIWEKFNHYRPYNRNQKWYQKQDVMSLLEKVAAFIRLFHKEDQEQVRGWMQQVLDKDRTYYRSDEIIPEIRFFFDFIDRDNFTYLIAAEGQTELFNLFGRRTPRSQFLITQEAGYVDSCREIKTSGYTVRHEPITELSEKVQGAFVRPPAGKELETLRHVYGNMLNPSEKCLLLAVVNTGDKDMAKELYDWIEEVHGDSFMLESTEFNSLNLQTNELLCVVYKPAYETID